MEKEKQQELNVHRNEFIGVCAIIGYHTLPVRDGLPHLIRPLYPQNPFPRFHLKIKERDSKVDAELHFDIRKHRGRVFGVSLSEELDRLVKILYAKENPSGFTTQLLYALRSQALFGTSEAEKRRNTAGRRLVAGIKKAKMKKGTRARFLSRRYSLDELYQSDLE